MPFTIIIMNGITLYKYISDKSLPLKSLIDPNEWRGVVYVQFIQ